MQKLTIYNFEEVLKPHLSQLGEEGLSLFESLQSFVAKIGYIKNAEFEASLASFESWLILNTNHLINQPVTKKTAETPENTKHLINQPVSPNKPDNAKNANTLINQPVSPKKHDNVKNANTLINQTVTNEDDQQPSTEHQQTIDYSVYDIDGLRVGEKLEVVKYLHSRYGYPLDKQRVFEIGVREIARRAKRDTSTKYSPSILYNLIRNVLNIDSQLID